MYIHNFPLAYNIRLLMKELKKYLAKKYNIKNIRKVKTIIG